MKTLLALLMILAPAVILSPAAVAAPVPAPQATPQQIQALETELVNAINRGDIRAFQQALNSVPPGAVEALSSSIKVRQAIAQSGPSARHFDEALRNAATPGGAPPPVIIPDVVDDSTDTDTDTDTPPDAVKNTGITTTTVVTTAVVIGVAVAVANKSDDKVQGPTDTTGGN